MDWILKRPLIKHPEAISRFIRSRPRSDYMNKDTRMWKILDNSFKNCPKDLNFNDE
jgi:hypothetical protein